MATCVPELLRFSDESGVKNRSGITESELNKYLVKCGYSKFRDRKRVKGTSDKWDEGCPKWKGREWMNPSDDDDICELRDRLRDCLAFVTNMDLCILEEAIITNLKSIWSEFSDEFTVSKPCERGLGKHNLALCQDVPRMCMTVHHRSILGEAPRFLWPAGLERVPLSFGSVFHAFYQLGASPRDIFAIFAHLPPDLRAAVEEAGAALTAIRTLRGTLNPDGPRHPPPPPLSLEGGAAPFDDAEVGVNAFSYSPVLMAREEVYVNPAHCEQAGIPAPAMLALVAAHALPNRFCEVEALTLMLEVALKHEVLPSPQRERGRERKPRARHGGPAGPE